MFRYVGEAKSYKQLNMVSCHDFHYKVRSFHLGKIAKVDTQFLYKIDYFDKVQKLSYATDSTKVDGKEMQ